MAEGLPMMNSTPVAPGGNNYSFVAANAAVPHFASFIPTALLMMTSFTWVVIVYCRLVASGAGTMQSPPNQVIVGLSPFFIPCSSWGRCWIRYTKPGALLLGRQDQFLQALDGSVPMKQFMMRQTREKDLEFFIEVSQSAKPRGPEDISMKTWRLLYHQRDENRLPNRFYDLYSPFDH